MCRRKSAMFLKPPTGPVRVTKNFRSPPSPPLVPGISIEPRLDLGLADAEHVRFEAVAGQLVGLSPRPRWTPSPAARFRELRGARRRSRDGDPLAAPAEFVAMLNEGTGAANRFAAALSGIGSFRTRAQGRRPRAHARGNRRRVRQAARRRRGVNERLLTTREVADFLGFEPGDGASPLRERGRIAAQVRKKSP